MGYLFWKRFDTRKTALAEAAKLRKMGKRAKVVPLKGYGERNFDVMVYM